MAGTTDTQISRRSALALAATLAATVVAALGAYGGLTHWRAQAAHPAPASHVIQVVQAAPASPFPVTEEAD